jgi:hypothetical protein
MTDTDSTKGIMLAYEVYYDLIANQFKDLTLDEIDGFRETMAAFLNLKKED